MAELSVRLPGEIQRRKKWFKSLSLIQDSGYSDSNVTEALLAGIRAELSHGLVGEANKYLWHAGGDPNFYSLDLEAGEKSESWKMDFIDKCDRVRKHDL